MPSGLTEPVVIVGIGGAGSRLAGQAREILGYDTMIISHDAADLIDGCPGILVSANGAVNPSSQLLRGAALAEADRIRKCLAGYRSVILICNLAGKGGTALAPVVSHIARKMILSSFAIMPFGYEKERIFASGVALRRLREDSGFVVVVDNDSMVTSNPDLTPAQCRQIANSAMLHVVSSLDRTEVSDGLDIVSTSRDNFEIEMAMRDSLKMLYGDARPGSVGRSVVHLIGGDRAPVGVISSVASMASYVLGKGAQMEVTTDASEETKVVMVSTVYGQTRFDGYDPLGAIPKDSRLDWDEPDCNMDCGLDLYQIE